MPSQSSRKKTEKKIASQAGSIIVKSGSASHIRFANGEKCESESNIFFWKGFT